MMVDIPQERGMAHADVRWGRKDVCRFPLFSDLKVAPLEWMYIIYLIMFIGTCIKLEYPSDKWGNFL